MKKIITYKYRIFPNKRQEKELSKTLDLCRDLYNNILEYKNNTYKKIKISPTKYEIMKQLPEIKNDLPEYKQAYSQVLQNVVERVDTSYKNFFRNLKRGVVGFPKFKGKRFYKSFTYPQTGFKIVDNKLRLSKIGDIKIKYHREIDGKIKQLTIRQSNNKWFACFSVLVDRSVPCGNLVAGIDLGISQFIVFNDGRVIDNPKFFKIYEDKLKKCQRKISKAKKGSKQRYKFLKVLNKIYEKLANKKHDFFHKLANKLISMHKVIVIEDLSIKSMIQIAFRGLRKSINETSWNSFVNILTYKADFSDCKLIKVDPKNTTKMCSKCGELVEKSLDQRTHGCDCGLVMDRDHNAAINILRLGLQSLEEVPRSSEF